MSIVHASMEIWVHNKTPPLPCNVINIILVIKIMFEQRCFCNYQSFLIFFRVNHFVVCSLVGRQFRERSIEERASGERVLSKTSLLIFSSLGRLVNSTWMLSVRSIVRCEQVRLHGRHFQPDYWSNSSFQSEGLSSVVQLS